MNRWTNNYYKQQSGVVVGDGVGEGRGRQLHPAHEGGLTAHSRRRRSSHGKVEGKEVAHLWVFRVVHLTEVTLRSFIERQGIQVLNVQLVSHKEAAYKSFLVTVNEGDAATLLQRAFWPGLVACRLWHDRGDGRRGDALSRRSAKGTRTALYNLDAQVGDRGQESEDNLYNPGANSTQRSPRSDHLPRDSQRTVAQVGSGSKSNFNSRERKAKEKNSKNSNGLRKGDKNTHAKTESKRKSSNLVKGDAKLKSDTINITAKHEKSVKGKESKLSDAKKKVKKKKTKGMDKHADEKDKSSKRENERDRGAKEGVHTNREASRMPDEEREHPGGNSKLTDNYNDSKKPVGGKDRNSALHKGNKRRVDDIEKVGKHADDRYANDRREDLNKSEKYESHSSQHVKGRHWNDGPEPHYLPPKDGTVARKSANRNYSKYPSTSTVTNKTYVKSSEAEKTKYPSWVVSLSTLLILSSEEVVAKLLGPQFDELLGQEDISDDELFLGVKVLAHAARAKCSNEDLRLLVYKIWQPLIINLIKTFSVTVERRYPERAERYFWDLAEFLDLYIIYNLFIEDMSSLLSTCVSEVLALSYKSYVSDDLVKVYRSMQDRVAK